MERFQKHISRWEKTTAVIFCLLLLLTVVTQLFFDGDVLLLLLVFAICAAVFSWMVFSPETYEIQDDFLVIYKGRGERCTRIEYSDIRKIDTIGSFRGLKKDFDSVEVVLKYRPKESRWMRSVSCHPQNVLGFVKLLRAKCPDLDVEAE